MDVEVDHYDVLGLPSGEVGARLSEQEISKAYRSKARELHPDKRREDPNAHTDFLKLQTSYEVLKDEKGKKLFDDLLRLKREKLHRQRQRDSKRQKVMSDLEEKERSFCAADPSLEAKKEEQRISKKLKLEITEIRSMKKAATRHVLGDLSNPLLVSPLQSASMPFVFSAGRNESSSKKLSNLVGADYPSFEESVLNKLMKKVGKKYK